MMNPAVCKLSLLCALMLAGCASHDDQDRFLLGEANRQNIAAQAVRDVALPNSMPVSSSSGHRAARAVQALNEKPVRTLAETDTGTSE